MDEKNRIIELLTYLGLNASSLAKSLGMSTPQVFYDIKAGKCGISKDLAQKIQEKYLNVNRAWLLTGEGEMLNSNINQSVEGNNNTQIAGNDNNVNSSSILDKAIDEFSAQRKLTEKAIDEFSAQRKLTERAMSQIDKQQEQIDRLISLLEQK